MDMSGGQTAIKNSAQNKLCHKLLWNSASCSEQEIRENLPSKNQIIITDFTLFDSNHGSNWWSAQLEVIMESQQHYAKLGSLEKTRLGQPCVELAVPLLLPPAELECPTNTCPTGIWVTNLSAAGLVSWECHRCQDARFPNLGKYLFPWRNQKFYPFLWFAFLFCKECVLTQTIWQPVCLQKLEELLFSTCCYSKLPMSFPEQGNTKICY